MSEKGLEKKLKDRRKLSEKLKGKEVNLKLARESTSTEGYHRRKDNRDLDMRIRKKNGKWKVVFLNEYGNIVESRIFPDKFTALRYFYWKKYPEVCINGMCTDSKNNNCERREECQYWQDNKEEIQKRWPHWNERMKEESDMFDEVDTKNCDVVYE